MLGTQKREEEAAIASYPQPLRDLIIADEHPDDSDLKHLSEAIQAIRETPDPKLLSQLVQEIHEGTLRIRSLLNHVLLNENNLLNLKPWGEKQEAIAVGACIESLLRVCGGGEIEIESKNGGRRIEVTATKNGYTLTLGGASHPLSFADAQKELRRRYEKSKAE